MIVSGGDSKIHVPQWGSPPVDLCLGLTEVHVWQAALDPSPLVVERLRGVLSPDEQARATRFCFERDRRRFITARGTLRLILSRYLLIEPTRVTFHYGPHGKPFLANECEGSRMQFNLSHAQERALYAFNLERAIGVDLEYLKPETDVRAIAIRFFSPSESAALLALPPAQRLEAFFKCWTRKEAYLKGRGLGLSLPLDQFDVSFVTDQFPRLLETRHDPAEAQRWSLQALDPAPGYTGAVAVEGQPEVLKCWQWAESYFHQDHIFHA